MADYQRLDPNAATDKYTKVSLRQRIIERLTIALAEHGFERKISKSCGFYFWRPLGDESQSILGDIKGSSPDYELDVGGGGGGTH